MGNPRDCCLEIGQYFVKSPQYIQLFFLCHLSFIFRIATSLLFVALQFLAPSDQ